MTSGRSSDWRTAALFKRTGRGARRMDGRARCQHEEQGGLRALRGALEKDADEPEQRRRLASKVRRDDAGVAGVDRHAGAREAAREFGREEDLRELRLAVRARAPIFRLPLEV